MKSMTIFFATAVVICGIISCGDLDSFVEPERGALAPLPASDCGEVLTEVDNITGLRWSGNGEEVFIDTWNEIRAIRLSDKSARTVVGGFNSPKAVSVSADGQKVYFTAMNDQWQTGLYVVTSGGTPTLLSANVYSVFVSADQRVAAYSSNSSAYVMDLARGTSRMLRTGNVLALSDDGAYAVVRDFPSPYYTEMCYHVTTATGAAEYFALASWNVWGFKWIGGDFIAYITEWNEQGLQLRTWRGSDGQYSAPLYLSGAASYVIDISKDGDRVAWWSVNCHLANAGSCDIQELSLHGMSLASRVDTTLARAYTRSNAYGNWIALSNDGQKAAFVVKRRLYVREVF